MAEPLPISRRPCPSELFSSWMTYSALSHGLTLNQLIGCLYPNTNFNRRDVDKLANTKVVNVLAESLSVDRYLAQATSVYLRALPISSVEDNIYKAEWITHVNNIYTTSRSFGMCYCPCCMSEDREPYFRVDWRLSFITLCSKHQCLLRNSCPWCKQEINLYRVPVGVRHLATCCWCGRDIREVSPQTSQCFGPYLEQQEYLRRLLELSHAGTEPDKVHVKEYFLAIYHFAHFIMENYYGRKSPYNSMMKWKNYERHSYLDAFSPINRLIILELAMRFFFKEFECNYKHHLQLKAAGKIREFHRRKIPPCGNWCVEHDYLKINANCQKMILKALDENHSRAKELSLLA